MPLLRHIFLIAVMIVFQIKYCNTRNNDWIIRHVPLNKNGMSYGSTKALWCESGQMIDLISYKFDNNITRDEFSATEELELYQKCSMQESCTNLRFPSRSCQHTNHTYYVAIKFQCIDPKTSNVMGMCENSHRTVKDTLHLMYHVSATTSATRCECRIVGKFSVTLNDLRLSVKHLNTCSSAILKINSNLFKCEENITSFGSVYQRKILSNFAIVYMLLTLNSTSSPTMVWLKIEPTDRSEVTCSGIPRSFTTTEIAATSVYHSSVFTEYASIDDNFTGSYNRSHRTTCTVVIIVCVSSTCSLCAIIIGVVVCCKRRKRIKRLRNTKRGHQTELTEHVQVSAEKVSPLHHTYAECVHHRPGACGYNANAADASTSCLTDNKAVKGETALTDDSRYYDESEKLESSNKTEQQAYAESQYQNQGAIGYDTQHQKNYPNESETLQDENNYYNVRVKLSSTHAVYEKIQPELKCNDEEYSKLD